MKKICLLLSVISTFIAAAQKFEGLALTPPMGWNSWNTFQVNINEQMIKDMADVMVSSGMKDAGYNYLIIDDAWMTKERDSSGSLVPDPKKFPHGMKAVADYVHSKGLKFGLYNCAGTRTCADYPGARGHEYQDARFYASLGVDYLKFDWCHSEGINAREAYATMSKALKTAGHPIVFSLCEWGSNQPWRWAKNIGQLWRTTGDIGNIFSGEKKIGGWSPMSVVKIIDLEDTLRQYAGPDHWNDPDMLEVGNGLTEGENRAHFSMWCILAAPLMAGNDLRSMNASTHDILTNKEAIAIDQDSLGIQGFKYATKDSVETWFKPLKDGDWAVAFLNRSQTPQPVAFKWKEETVNDSVFNKQLDTKTVAYQIRNLWTKKATGTTKKDLKATVPPHDILLFRLSK